MNKFCLREDRLGTKRVNTKGHVMVCVDYRTTNDITVRFDDGSEVITNWQNFESGCVRKPDNLERLGAIRYNNYGLCMTCIEYINSRKVVVRFKDGYVATTSWDRFNLGFVSNPRMRKSDLPSIGYSYTNNIGQKVVVVSVRDNPRQYRVTVDGCRKEGWFFTDELNGDLVLYRRASKQGIEGIAYNGIPFTIVGYDGAKKVTVCFADGVQGVYEWQIISRTRKIRQISRGSKIGDFVIDSFAFRLLEDDKVFYLCQCSKCGRRDILTPTQMLAHVCEETV